MRLGDELAGVLARDPRYTIHAYIFILEALEYSKVQKRRARPRSRGARAQAGPYANHVTGRELCEGARQLALAQYGLLAIPVLNSWGIYSTSDLGEIVYNLIAAGDLEKAPTDRRSDFDGVYDFEAAFRREFVLALDDVA